MYECQISRWKDDQHHHSKGKYKLKPQWDATIQQLEWLKFTKLSMPSVLEDVGWLELSDIPESSGKWYNHFGKPLGQFL